MMAATAAGSGGDLAAMAAATTAAISRRGGAEDAGRDDGEGAAGRGGEVVEAVDDAAGDEDEVAGGGFVALGLAVSGPEGEGERAFEGVTGLLVGVVAVGDGELRAGGTVNSNMVRGAGSAVPSMRKRMARPPMRISSGGVGSGTGFLSGSMR